MQDIKFSCLHFEFCSVIFLFDFYFFIFSHNGIDLQIAYINM